MTKSKLYGGIFDFANKELEIEKLQQESEDPTLWNDSTHAQQVMKQLTSLRREVEGWQTLRQRAHDALELAQLEDEDLRSELEPETDAIQKEMEKREFTAMLSGPYDKGDALLTINAGAGGTDSQDWAAMLQRMYLRWMERSEYGADILDATEGEVAGIKTITIAVKGEYAYGYLRAEKGVHRLVRLSPFDSNARRHTSFAQVEVLPQVEDDSELEINPNDLKIETYRSSGAGGQNVQKNDTAIRITHLPTGITASCQNERSQTQNRENAMKVLRSRLLEIKRQEQDKHLAELRGEYQKTEWGSQIRSYVLHPYQMVKDHRTDYETGNTQGVLDGDLDKFIEAYLRANVGKVV